MKINIKSWHYNIVKWQRGDWPVPSTRCKYFYHLVLGLVQMFLLIAASCVISLGMAVSVGLNDKFGLDQTHVLDAVLLILMGFAMTIVMAGAAIVICFLVYVVERACVWLTETKIYRKVHAKLKCDKQITFVSKK